MKACYNLKKLAIFCLALLFSFAAFAQEKIKPVKIDTANLPAGIKPQGSIKQAVRWMDSLGDNIVLLTETGVFKNNTFKHENDGWDAELFGYHFLVKQEIPGQTWKVYDFIKDCPVDIEASFIKKTLQVTDLDNDGIGEVWLMYKTVCHGDISPCDMKVIMYEGQQKFAMRGTNKVKVSANEFYGGEYTFDQQFNAAPVAFRDFAKKLWNNNIMQVWGEVD